MSSDPEGDGEWQFTLADLEDAAESEEVRPGDPTAENVAFFVLGVLVAVGSLLFLLFV
jgi:hypothetical protein